MKRGMHIIGALLPICAGGEAVPVRRRDRAGRSQVKTRHDAERKRRAEEKRARKRAKRRAHETEALAAFFRFGVPWLCAPIRRKR